MLLRTSITLGLGLAVVTGTTLAASPAQAVSPSSATSAIAFRAPTGAVSRADTVTYAVATPVVTRAMAGHPVTITMAGPARQDCRSLSLSMPGAALHATRATCTAARTVVTVVPPATAVGKRITLAGWSATTASTARVDGQVAYGRTVARTSVSARRPAPKTPTPQLPPTAPTPVGPKVVLGSDAGRQVSLASGQGHNEVWVGSTRYAALDGILWHSSLDGRTVHLWVKGTSSVMLWQLDLASGNPSVRSLPGVVQKEGDPGFFLLVPQQNSWDQFVLVDWSGTSSWTAPHIATSPGWPLVGFTHLYAVTKTGGQIANTVEFRDPHSGAVVDSQQPGGIYAVKSVDATGVTLTMMGGGTARVEPFKPVVFTQA